MQIINNSPEQKTLPTDKSAALLGIHEFSLFALIQTGEIKVARLRSGEMAVPETELERLLRTPANKFVMPPNQETTWLDNDLGIVKHHGGLKRNGESVEYSVANHPGQFTESEIKSYRAAFGAIRTGVDSLIGLKKQLDKLDGLPSEQEMYAQAGRWQIHSKLLNLGHSEILLGRLENEFAVVERFQDGSAYAKNNGRMEIMQCGKNAGQLVDDFKANSQLTLEFMASNLTAKAQKVVWEQFPDCRPSHVIAAISERCRQAVSNGETISQSQTVTQPVSRGIKI
jgi:hypothetical protein